MDLSGMNRSRLKQLASTGNIDAQQLVKELEENFQLDVSMISDDDMTACHSGHDSALGEESANTASAVSHDLNEHFSVYLVERNEDNRRSRFANPLWLSSLARGAHSEPPESSLHAHRGGCPLSAHSGHHRGLSYNSICTAPEILASLSEPHHEQVVPPQTEDPGPNDELPNCRANTRMERSSHVKIVSAASEPQPVSQLSHMNSDRLKLLAGSGDEEARRALKEFDDTKCGGQDHKRGKTRHRVQHLENDEPVLFNPKLWLRKRAESDAKCKRRPQQDNNTNTSDSSARSTSSIQSKRKFDETDVPRDVQPVSKPRVRLISLKEDWEIQSQRQYTSLEHHSRPRDSSSVAGNDTTLKDPKMETASVSPSGCPSHVTDLCEQNMPPGLDAASRRDIELETDALYLRWSRYHFDLAIYYLQMYMSQWKQSS